MTHITLANVGIEFPVYNASSRSLKNKVMKIATGGIVGRRQDGHIVVRGLNKVSFSLGEGDRLGLIGHNGSGKTTLLRVLSGIYTPVDGFAEINGTCVSLINIGLGIDPEATGRENIRLRSAMMGLSRAELRKYMADIEEFSELGGFLDMPFRTYSSGMQLRLAFSVSTVVRPDILIMDEWLSTGDEDFRERANARLKEILKSTKILVLASHSKELLLQNCNRIIWLEHGEIRMDDDANRVAEAYFRG